jgi:hypothetical protein
MEQTEKNNKKALKDLTLILIGIVALFGVLYLIKYLLGI